MYERCLEAHESFPKRLDDWASYDYDHANLTYLPRRYRRGLENVSDLSAFLDVADKASGLTAVAARAYSKIAAARCRRGSFGWMPEVTAIRLLREWMQW